jgi:hypothetical protein
MKLSGAVQHILTKTAHKILTIGENHLPFAILLICNKIALIVDPVLVDEVEVAVVEGLV